MKRLPHLLTLTRRVVLGTGLLLGAVACGEPPAPHPLAQRLVDVFRPDLLTGSIVADGMPARTEWSFENATDTLGWEAIEGVVDLRVRDGRLVARSTSDLPILRTVREGGSEDSDQLYEIYVRMSATAGTDVGMHFVGRQPSPMDSVQARRLFWNATGPIVADGEMHTYVFKITFPVVSADVREVHLGPTNAAGAEFEIESVRLVFRREFLAEQPSGVGWLGLGGEFRETLTARAPETIRWPVTLPERPRLQLGLGTLTEQPVTFRISLLADDDEILLCRRTLTTPERWEDVEIDLDAHATDEVTLLLALESGDGTPGLWGAPAVRSRVAPDAVTEGDVQAVILILGDTLRFDRLSFYGHDRLTAPRLGELAREGTVFREAHAHAPWTRVSAPSLLTSLYPLSHGLRGPLARLPNSAVTLAEVYREAGWTTVGFSAVPHTGRSANMHQGYEILFEGLPDGGPFSKTAQGFVDRLLPWLQLHRHDRFFVFLHLFDPHFPYEPSPPFDTLWADPSRRPEHQRRFQQVTMAIADPLQRSQGMAHRREMERAGVDPRPYIEQRLDWYDGSIRAMDTELGRVFERLHELGLADRTLLAFTSDHGEEFLEHDWMGHGQSLYDELTHVPLLLWRPGSVPGETVIEAPVQQIDLMPTLLELSSLPVPEAAQGQSLVPLLTAGRASAPRGDRGWRPRPVVSERPADGHPFNPPPRGFSSTALLFEGWKLIHNGEGRGELPEYELFDHSKDPGDAHDLAAERPEVVERLAGLLASWRQEAAARKLQGDAELSEDLSQEELERLRSLGYIQ